MNQETWTLLISSNLMHYQSYFPHVRAKGRIDLSSAHQQQWKTRAKKFVSSSICFAPTHSFFFFQLPIHHSTATTCLQIYTVEKKWIQRIFNIFLDSDDVVWKQVSCGNFSVKLYDRKEKNFILKTWRSAASIYKNIIRSNSEAKADDTSETLLTWKISRYACKQGLLWRHKKRRKYSINNAVTNLI